MANNKKQALKQWLQDERPPLITEEHFVTLRRHLAPVSIGYLRRLLRANGAALSPLVEGVVQDSLEALERTLRGLSAEYEQAGEGRRRLIRQMVIQAKDHARWAALRSREHKAEKQQMAEWLLMWLENPAVFPLWANLLHKRNAGD